MTHPAITVDLLQRVFKVPERDPGMAAAVKSLFRRTYRQVLAVDAVSFDIAPGEMVGFLGPNGAGKTTTLKMLAGLLHPTGGQVSVLGYRPAARDRAYLRQMALVMGNRNQLLWDLPAADTYELNRAIYQIPWPDFRRTRDELVEMLEIGDLIRKPVRNLSLGERMKVEIAGSLLHQPKVLFLDEPTLGLDVSMQKRIRAFIAEYNARHGASVLLTSHYMADVEALCRRVIVIHHGRIVFDGNLTDLSTRVASYKELGLTLADAGADLSAFGQVRQRDGDRVVLRVPKDQIAKMTAALLAECNVVDLTVEDPPIDDIIEMVFSDSTIVADPQTAGRQMDGLPMVEEAVA